MIMLVSLQAMGNSVIRHVVPSGFVRCPTRPTLFARNEPRYGVNHPSTLPPCHPAALPPCRSASLSVGARLLSPERTMVRRQLPVPSAPSVRPFRLLECLGPPSEPAS